MKKKSKWIKIILIVILLGAVSAGAYYYVTKRAEEKQKELSNSQNTATVTKGIISSSLSSSGTISPKDTYTITSLVAGDVIEADFEEGDQVEKGQILYRIDASSMDSEVDSANNSLTRSENSYQKALDEYNAAKKDYSNFTYKSNRTGFIKKLNVEAGDKVSSNTEIANIYNDQTMKLKVPFLNTEAVYIGPGQQAVLTLSDTEEQLAGVVTAVSNMDETLDGGRIVRYVTIETSNPGGLTTSHTAYATIGTLNSCTENSFEPATDTTMKADITGNGSLEIERLLVNEGDYITDGTPLFKIKESDVNDILQTYKDSVDSAEEKVESSKSKVDSTKDTYENYTITAPISGTVITKSVKVGDKIDKSSSSTTSTLAVIYDLSEVTFQMSVDELDVKKVQVGQTVSVTADAVKNKKFTGKVTNISLQSSQSNGVTNYPVTITLDEVGELLPGMNVDGVITLEEKKNTLMIPVDSLMRGNKVYIKDDSVTTSENNVPVGFKAVQVETGITNASYVEVLSGVSEGDVIYVDSLTKASSFSPTIGFEDPMEDDSRGQGGGNRERRSSEGRPGGN